MSQLPPAAHLLIRGDRSQNIRDAFTDIQVTMLLTLILVIAVIFFFLRNLPATIIPEPGAAIFNSRVRSR